MITDQDITKLKTIFATKEDLKSFVTKDDLEKSELRTNDSFTDVQSQLNVLKDDVSVLKKDVSVLKQDVTILKQDVTILKQDVSELKQDVASIKDHLLTMEDNIMGELRSIRLEQTVNAGVNRQVKDHENRLTKVESIVLPS